ncbi:MAG: UDP-N-acetyl-D-mannosamine dehydrogenase, partial [Pseudomonadota bacterium]
MIRSATVIGLGYVGLPTAAVFAEAGLDIIGVDVNEEAVASINAGQPHIVEPNLDALLRRVVESGKLRATSSPERADVYVIAVPTPFTEGKKPDLTYIRSAAAALAPVLDQGALIILESTSPVGATEQLAAWLAADRPDLSFPQDAGDLADVQVAHCPERVLPGKVLHEVVHNSRVIGGMTRHCAARAVAFYQIAVKGECHVTDARTAELAKLTENAFRDVNIAFANELSVICKSLDIDPWELIAMANKHPRVNILNPGPGVGGHCIAVDPWFIVDSAPEQSRLIRTARDVNDAKPDWVVERISETAA